MENGESGMTFEPFSSIRIVGVITSSRIMWVRNVERRDERILLGMIHK